MRLSEILDRLIQLEQLDDHPFDAVLDRMIRIKELYSNVKFANRQEIGLAARDLSQSIIAYKNEINDLKSRLEKNVYENQQQFIDDSEKFYQQNINKMTFDEYVEWSKQWKIAAEELNHFAGRISNHCHWQQPALIVGSNDYSMLEPMISADPLYVLERYTEYFRLQKEKFADLSARKVRFYSLDDIKLLPNDSFSVIAVLNQFGFLPWKQTSEMITQFSKCLAPGGCLVFNYNNCRTVKGFRFFEQHLASFSLPSMYTDLCESIGLHPVLSYDSTVNPFSIMEFRKPGSIKLVKKHPSVGMVKQQPTASNKALHDVRIKKLIHIFKS